MKTSLGFGALLAAMVLCSACSVSPSIPVGAPQNSMASAARHDDANSDTVVDDAVVENDAKTEVSSPIIQDKTPEPVAETPAPMVAQADSHSDGTTASVSSTAVTPVLSAPSDPAIIYNPEMRMAARTNTGDVRPSDFHDGVFASSSAQQINPQAVNEAR